MPCESTLHGCTLIFGMNRHDDGQARGRRVKRRPRSSGADSLRISICLEAEGTPPVRRFAANAATWTVVGSCVLAMILLWPERALAPIHAALLSAIAGVGVVAMCLAYSRTRPPVRACPSRIREATRVSLLIFVLALAMADIALSCASLRHGGVPVGMTTIAEAERPGSQKANFTGCEWTQTPSRAFAPDTSAKVDDRRSACRVLLVTASADETKQLKWWLLASECFAEPVEVKPQSASYTAALPSGRDVSVRDSVAYYVGTLGPVSVVVVQCEQGSVGPRASEVVTAHAIRDWQPRAVICVGAGFATNRRDLSPGDVLVSERLYPYEHAKIYPDGRLGRRADPLPVDSQFLQLFRAIPNWSFGNPGGLESVEAHFGAILTGEKLVNNLEFREALLDRWPDAIGGEMEGAGVAAAATAAGIPWIVVKGVMDWGDGKKNDDYKQLAAAAAAAFVGAILSGPTAGPLVCALPGPAL